MPTVRSQSQKHPRISQGEDDQNPRRIRLLTKGPGVRKSSEEEVRLWEQILKDIAPTLPRVGRSEVKDTQILQRIQELVGTQNTIKPAVGGKGMNRTTAPLRTLEHGEAPWRKLVYIHRNTGKIHGIHQWEKWEDLSRRQLVRTGYPSSVAITIFTGNPLQVSASEQLTGTSRARSVSDNLVGPAQSEEQSEAVHPMPASEASDSLDNSDDIDAQSNHHGPLLKQLSKEDRALLLKIHKNAGHPGPDKLSHLLKQLGFRPKFVAAASDLRCSACQSMSRPKISRAAAIHTPCDFNDIISMDGYSWKNQQGTSYHFYHIVDHSTSFQVAKYAPNRSVEHAIDAIVQSWFSWAGSPNEMIVDAATELNAESFSQFMHSAM